MIWFATSGFVNAFGTGFFYSFSILFFHRLFHLPIPTVGAILTGAGLPGCAWYWKSPASRSNPVAA